MQVASTGLANSSPALVWTGKEYGLAWRVTGATSTEIYFARIDRAGNRIGTDLPLTNDPANQEAPSLVWTGSEYGVSWHDRRHASANDPNWEIYFARIDATGNKLGADVRVTDAAGHSNEPALTWTGTEFGVAWQDRRLGYPAIYFARIDTAGVRLESDLQITLPHQWLPCACQPRQVTLVWTGNAYGVAWLWDDLFLGPTPLEFARIHCEANQPPVAACAEVTVEAPADACVAAASVDGGSFDPDGDAITLAQAPPGPYPIGTTELTLTATDDRGASDACTATVTVVEATPPELAVEFDPDVLWPPNHRLVDVAATVIATDLCSTPVVLLSSITSDEPDDAPDGVDGDTTNDIQGADLGTADLEFQLRAERMGAGDGRVYAVTYTAVDGSGNETRATATVLVPHDLGGVVDPLALQVISGPGGTAVQWNQVDEAQWYNVIRGDLAELQILEQTILLGRVQCIEARSIDTSTVGLEDSEGPAPGQTFFFLIEYHDRVDTGYGTASAPKPRIPAVLSTPPEPASRC